MGFKHLTLCTIVLAQLLSLASGQVGSALSSVSSAASSVAASAASASATRVIMVGNGDHKFRPEVTQANIGDIIEFQFFPPNHSVVRAEYLYPCIPYEMTGRGKTGFWSGFKPVDAILSSPPTWRIRVNDTNPIFFYCSAVGSCINYGMVGVINPNSTTSLETHRQLARDSAYMLNPGESFPSEGGTSTSSKSSSSSASATVNPVTTVTAPPAATTSADAAPSKGGLSTGAIAGIAVGAVVILVLAAGLCFFMGRTKSLKQEVDRNSSLPPHVAPSMLQHQPYMPKSNMTDASSRNSFSGTPRPFSNPPYEVYQGMGGTPIDSKADYLVTVDETSRLRAASPRSPQFNANGPMRHPSVLLNPNDPQEMHSPDNRYRDGY